MIHNQYTRDLAGRITAIAAPGTTNDWTYEYNNLDQLLVADNAGTASLDETFTYTLSGNLLTRSRGAYTLSVSRH